MSLRILSILFLSFMFGTITTGCSALKKHLAEEEALRNSITDTESLINYLGEEGLSLIHDGKFTSPQMTTAGDEYTVTSGGGLYVFTFPSGADASAALSWVREGRNVTSPLQVYQKETLVVIYYGTDPRMERALVRAMGSRVS